MRKKKGIDISQDVSKIRGRILLRCQDLQEAVLRYCVSSVKINCLMEQNRDARNRPSTMWNFGI